MEELLKLVELVKQEAPQARVKVDSLMVMHYFTMEELLNICNKYAEYKCALADVVGQSEQYCDWCSSTEEVEVKICKRCRRGMDDHR